MRFKSRITDTFLRCVVDHLTLVVQQSFFGSETALPDDTMYFKLCKN